MGYEIVLCKVESVDTVTKRVLLKPHTPSHFSTIEVTAGDGLKFASSYAPYTRVADPDKGKVFNAPVGFVNYPQQDDLVLAAIWITDVSRQDRLRPKLSQNQNMEVIIFAKISWQFPDIGTHDNILGDRSGAKIHFNHGWLDTDHLGEDVQGDKTIHLPTGHVTSVGNRVVRISGKKFLPFGLHSHNLGKEGVNRDNSKIINEVGGEPISWGKAFTQDPAEANLYNDLISLSKRGSKKFLEPPCPPPSSLMDFHESGYKHLVPSSGHVRSYQKSHLSILGGFDGEGIDDAQAMSFDPDTFPEPAALNDGEVVMKFIGTNNISHFMMKNNKAVLECAGLSINMRSSGLPTGISSNPTITEDDVDAGKFKIYVNGALQFTFSADDDEMVIENDVKIKGNLDVTGSVDSGAIITATTKVVTPTVEGP